VGNRHVICSRRRLRQTGCLLFALIGALAGPRTVCSQTPTTAFTLPFDWTTNKIAILPSSNWGLFKVGDTITISTSNNLPITIFNLYGQTVYSGAPKSMTLAAGHYFIQCIGDRNQFTVLPSDYAGASFLADMANDSGWIDYAQRQQRMGISWVRAAAAAWKDVQPQAGVWNWSEMDLIITNNSGKKIMLMAGSGNVPSWVQPANLTSNYAAFVTALVNRYKGKIAAIEIWNEPWFTEFWNSPNWLQMLDQLVAAGRASIKAIDPSILVLGPSWSTPGQTSDTATLSQYGFGSQIDGFSWHDYWAYDVPPDQDITRNGSVIPGILGRVQRYRQAAGFHYGPLYISELGLYGQSALGMPYPPVPKGLTGGPTVTAPDWQTGMSRAIKYAVLYRAMGAEMMMPLVFSLGGFSLTDDQDTVYGWEYGYRGPAPKTSAFLMACYWLNNAQFVDYRFLGQKVFLLAWQRPNGASAVFAWTIEGQPVTLSSTAGLNATDIFGNSISATSLTSTPILFQSNTTTAVALLSNLMTKLPSLNLAPVLPPVSNQTIQKGQTLRLRVTATDPDNDPITYSANSLPTGATIDPVSGLFSWTPDASQGGAYTITFLATDARRMSSSTATIINVIGAPRDGLVHEWKLDEISGTTAADSAGSADGTLVNFTLNSTWLTGHDGNGLSFNGASSYVNLGNSQINLTNNFTVAAWVYPRDAAGSEVFMAVRLQYPNSGLRLFINGNKITIEAATTVGLKVRSFALGQIQNNTWYHIVIVYDKSTMNVYLNGVAQLESYGGDPFWGGDLVMNPSAGSTLGLWFANFFNGILDNVMIFNRTLGPAEVTAMYNGEANITRLRPPSALRVISN